jgi:type I restriction enzyme, S subunit
VKAVHRLDEVCEVVMGQAPSGEAYNTDGKGWPLIAGAGDFGETKPLAKKFTTEASKLSRDGDIVLGIRASIGEKVVADGEYCLGRGVASLRAREPLAPRFLWHWLTHSAPRLAAKAKGATFKQVNREDIGELEIHLPPLAEQQRIAEVLDRAEALRAKRRATLAQLDSLTQSLFLDLFGDPVSNPKNWPDSTTLGDIAEIVSGITKGRKVNGKSTRGIPYLSVANVQDRALDLSVVKSIDATEEEIRRFRLEKNDLLLTEGGDPDKLGRGTLWNDELPECIHQNHIFRIRLAKGELTPLFVNWLIGSQRGKKYFLRAAKQTTGIATINTTQLRNFPLLMSPLHLQREFARRVGAVEKLKTAQRASLAEMDALFASLQHRAFRGEL